MIKILLSLVLPALAWLLLGGPDLLNNSAKLFVFSVVALHLLAVIWNRLIFKIFGGDVYTYGAVNFALNVIACAYTLVISASLFHKLAVFQWIWGEAVISKLSDLPKAFIGLSCLGLLFTLLIPMLTSRSVSPLPQKSDRRDYETPGQGGI
ncbi:MAG: hypothetical protein WCK08_12085 [Betaproteobacteria bacterium]|jgi:hypothetical protein